MSTQSQKGPKPTVSSPLLGILSLALLASLALPAYGASPEKLWTEKKGPGGIDPNSEVKMSAFAELASEVSGSVINIRVQKIGSRQTRLAQPNSVLPVVVDVLHCVEGRRQARLADPNAVLPVVVDAIVVEEVRDGLPRLRVVRPKVLQGRLLDELPRRLEAETPELPAGVRRVVLPSALQPVDCFLHLVDRDSAGL